MHYKNVLFYIEDYIEEESEVERSFSYMRSYLPKENILTRFHLYLLLSKFLKRTTCML